MTNIESLLDSWKNDNLTPEEKLKLLQLLDGKEGEDQFKQVWEKKWTSQPVPQANPIDIDSRLDSIRLEIKNQIRQDKQTQRVKRIRFITAIAASVIILLVGGWFLSQSQNDSFDESQMIAATELIEVKVEKGGRFQRTTLPDGSVVWLNVDSKIEYPTSFADTLRKVQIEGEAYFEVKEDKQRPFIVAVKDVETKVLGTTFFVSAYPESPVRVTLESGKVQVTHQSGKQVELKPNDQLISDPENAIWEVVQVNTDLMGYWKKGLLAYSGIPLGKLTPILERWYGVQIVFDNPAAKNCIVYGSPTDKSLKDLLGSYYDIGAVTYRKDQLGIVHIGGGNCP